jgi:hypothetical protein
MYSFRPSVKQIGAACAGVLLATLVTDTARSQQEAADPAQALADWLDCDKCEHGELDAVTHYGQAIGPGLIAALNQGPSPETRDALGKALAERHDELVEQSKKNPYAPITMSKERFVALYGGRLDAQHRIRAAQALAVIGGDAARAALEAAAASQAQRDDVLAAVTKLLTEMRGRN